MPEHSANINHVFLLGFQYERTLFVRLFIYLFAKLCQRDGSDGLLVGQGASLVQIVTLDGLDRDILNNYSI